MRLEFFQHVLKMSFSTQSVESGHSFKENNIRLYPPCISQPHYQHLHQTLYSHYCQQQHRTVRKGGRDGCPMTLHVSQTTRHQTP
jgi:hypothetical protein